MSTLEHTLKSEAVRRLEVITGTGRRRRFKQPIDLRAAGFHEFSHALLSDFLFLHFTGELASDHCLGSGSSKMRSGMPCQSPAVKGKRRCRMHGGAEESGAPKGNQNAFKHARYTKKAIADRRELRRFMREANTLLKEFES